MIPYRIAFANPGTKITEEDRMSYKKADKIDPGAYAGWNNTYRVYEPRRICGTIVKVSLFLRLHERDTGKL